MGEKMETKDNQRVRLRVPFVTEVLLKFDQLDTIISAKMKNISIIGIFVETDQKVPEKTPCRVEIILKAEHSRLTMETEGFVSRQDPDGLGIQFSYNNEWFSLFAVFEPYGRTDK
jgi:hypothetical protein